MNVAFDYSRVVATLRENQLALFLPSPGLSSFLDSKSRRIFIRAANRAGKSMHAAAKLAQIMLDNPDASYRAVGVNYKQSIRVISKYLRYFLPPSALEGGSTYSTQNGWTHNLIRLKNGTTCQILSADQKIVAHAGDDLDGVWIDEVPPPGILEENIARVMSKGGWIWLTMTPVGRPVEEIKSVVESPDSRWEHHVLELSEKNCPWYSRRQIQEWMDEAAASPGTYRQRIYGDWEGDTLSRVFTGWDTESTVTGRLSALVGHQPYDIGIGIDHGEGVGKQVAIFTVWTSDDIYIIDEIVNVMPTTPAEDAVAIMAKLAEWDWNLLDVNRIVGDINSAGKLAGGRQINDILTAELHSLAKYRSIVRPVDTPQKGKGSVIYGEKLINHALLQGHIKVHERCAGLIRSFRHYSPGDESLKHPIDALRYLIQPVLESRTASPQITSKLRLR